LISLLGLATDLVRERQLTDLAREIGLLGCPISEGGTEAMHGHVGAAACAAQRLRQELGAETPCGVWSDEYVIVPIFRRQSLQQPDGALAERDTMLLAALHAASGPRPHARG